jgi:hypothetical protein
MMSMVFAINYALYEWGLLDRKYRDRNAFHDF